MGLTEIAGTLRSRARSGSAVVLDAGVVPDSTLRDRIRLAFGLPATDDLTLTGLKAGDIPDPRNDALEIAKGRAAILGRTNVPVRVRFSVSGGKIQVLVVATMASGWSFEASFPSLPTFPFGILPISSARFVFATEAQPAFPWPDDPTRPVRLEAGLSFLGEIGLSGVAGLPFLLGSGAGAGSFRLFGSFSPVAGQALPVGKLQAPLASSGFSVGAGPYKLDLGTPTLAVLIPRSDDSPIQWVELLVEAEMGGNLAVSIGLSPSGSTFAVRVRPKPGVSTSDLLPLVPGGSELSQHIPAELTTVFDHVGLVDFRMVLDTSPAVTWVEVAGGTVKPWKLVPDVLTLQDLTLRVASRPSKTGGSKLVSIDASAEFFPDVFPGTFGFSVELAQQTSSAKTSWQIQDIRGYYDGRVSLRDIVDKFGGAAPEALQKLLIGDLGIQVTRSGAAYTYSLHGGAEVAFPVLGTELAAQIYLAVTKTPGGFDCKLTGAFSIAEQSFWFALALKKADPGQSTTFALTATWESTGEPLQLGAIASALDLDVPELPQGVDVALRSVGIHYDLATKTFELVATSDRYGEMTFVAVRGTGTGAGTAARSRYCLRLSLGLSFGLGQLPLLGEVLPAAGALELRELGIVYGSAPFTAAEITNINASLATIEKARPFLPGDLAGGCSLTAELVLGDQTQTFTLGANRPVTAPAVPPPAGGTARALPAGSAPPPASPPTAGTSAATTALTPVSPVQWVPVDKALGPLSIQKLGVSFSGGELGVFVGASVTLAGLTISLDGLGVSAPLEGFSADKLGFHLDGIGVSYSRPPLEISGAFLRNPAVTWLELGGMVTVKTSKFGLTLLGSFAKTDDLVSAFLYGVLDQPLGGPAFFVVTGLALGFGYNRTVVAPAIEKVATFPLVAAVTSPQPTSSAAQMLSSLGAALPISRGDMMLAAGVKFTSFKLIETFALLTVTFGNSLAVNLLGVSTLVVPPKEAQASGKAELVHVEMAFKASYLVETGALDVRAQLTPASYLLSRDCHVTGGMALCTWFQGPHEGDFVLTIGGYHPAFQVPAHYPTVPRLGLSWQVTRELAFRGSMYMALTPGLFMIGGSLQATYTSGSVRAWFLAEAHFLVGWQPFHYSARLAVRVGASCTFWLFGTQTISVEVGASVELWGPELSGRATIDLSVCSISFAFGAGASTTPKPLPWADFERSFLPQGKTCSIACAGGLLGQRKDAQQKEQWVVAADRLRIVFDSLVPTTSLVQATSPAPVTSIPVQVEGPAVRVGVAAMAVRAGNLAVTTTVAVTDAKTGRAVEGVQLRAVRKKMPAGLWGGSLAPSLRGAATVDAIGGVELTPAATTFGGSPRTVDTYRSAAARVVRCAAGPRSEPARRGSADLSAVKARLAAANAGERAALLAALGFSGAAAVDAAYIDGLACAPQVLAATTPAQTKG